MKLFRFLKKKQTDNFEALLQKAMKKPAYRKEFLKRLLIEKLVVIAKNDVGVEGFRVVQENTTFQLSSYKDGRIPVFTSSERIFDGGVIKEQVNFLELKGADLLKILKSKTLIINPYSDFSKELLPIEIEGLLDGTIPMDGPQKIELKEDTMVEIGQPLVYPTAVVNALIKLFSEQPNVEAAYVAFIHFPSSAEPPHYIFGLDARGNWDEISNEAGWLIQEVLSTGEIVDIVQLSKPGEIAGFKNYFTTISPFYKKAN